MLLSRHFPGRFLATALALVALAGMTFTLLPTASVAQDAADRSRYAVARTSLPLLDQPHGTDVLTRATQMLDGTSKHRGKRQSPDLSLAMREVFLARPRLGLIDGWRASTLLARPTDRAGDPYGDGYATASTRACATNVCVHYVGSGADAPPNRAWVHTTLSTMNGVWDSEVTRLGYQRPPSDRGRGGDNRFDVYLKDLGSQGLFGYCAPEARVPGERNLASAYCVLDNDFARSQYRRTPLDSLRVTAAHEFFHAIQFGYDYREDTWLLESTATWIEGQVAGDVDDNRSYLRFGQLAKPGAPLDQYVEGTLSHYGNWPLWQFLSERHGAGVVRDVWQRAAAFRGAPDNYSVQALKRALKSRGGLTRNYLAYAVANAAPGLSYREGAAYPAAPVAKQVRLSSRRRTARAGLRLDHLSYRLVSVLPGRTLQGKRWRLNVQVRGPERVTAPGAHLLIRKSNGVVLKRRVRLNSSGDGSARLRFSQRTVESIVLAVGNASTRYRCGEAGEQYACNGSPRDDNLRFRVRLSVARGGR